MAVLETDTEEWQCSALSSQEDPRQGHPQHLRTPHAGADATLKQEGSFGCRVLSPCSLPSPHPLQLQDLL